MEIPEVGNQVEVDYREGIAMEILLVVAERQPKVVAVVEAAVK